MTVKKEKKNPEKLSLFFYFYLSNKLSSRSEIKRNCSLFSKAFLFCFQDGAALLDVDYKAIYNKIRYYLQDKPQFLFKIIDKK